MSAGGRGGQSSALVSACASVRSRPVAEKDTGLALGLPSDRDAGGSQSTDNLAELIGAELIRIDDLRPAEPPHCCLLG